MQETKFTHTISRGSRYNQIYIPKEMSSTFQVGDIVEIKLIEKKSQLYYSKNLSKLGEFKERLIREIFSFLSTNKEIKQIFMFGSFLTKDVDYKDIDIILVSEKEIEEQVYNALIKKFSLKFHIISIPEKGLEESLKFSPMTRSMLYYFVSNKPFTVSKEIKVEKNHLLYLLMLPEDVLNIDIGTKMLYSSLRRLVTMGAFLENKEIAPDKIDNELIKDLGEFILDRIKEGESLGDKNLEKVRKIIKIRLNRVKKHLK